MINNHHDKAVNNKITEKPRPRLEYIFGMALLVLFGLMTFAWLGILLWVFLILIVIVLIYLCYYFLVKNRVKSTFTPVPYLRNLRQMEPIICKEYVFNLFTQHGYSGRILRVSEDDLIDMWLYKDGINYAVHFQHRFARMHVREKKVKKFFADVARYENVIGIIVTTTEFTNQARHWASGRGKKLRLVSGKKLARVIAGKIGL